MNYFLAKTEPGEFSIDDLEKNGTEPWNGVTNPVAVKHLRSMKLGDKVLIYHSGKEPGIVGLSEVVKEALQDPVNPKSWVPEVKFLKKFDQPISLAEIKASHKYDNWELVRQGRLSTMPVPDEFIQKLKELNVI